MLFFSEPIVIIANLIALGIGMTVHEFAHNYVGHMMGDPVPAREGRLTLNPFVHIVWWGWLMFAVLGFGVLGAAPISPYRMRSPRWGFLASVAAGPLSNLAVAAIFAVPLRLVATRAEIVTALTNPSVGDFLVVLFVQTVLLNVLLFLFNLLPLFPIDGWHIVYSLLPGDLANTWARWQQYTQYAFFALLLFSFSGFGPNILGLLIFQPMYDITFFLLGLR